MEVPCGRKLGDECISEYDCEFQQKVDYIPFPSELVFNPDEFQEKWVWEHGHMPSIMPTKTNHWGIVNKENEN
jgi:hypothetical protein